MGYDFRISYVNINDINNINNTNAVEDRCLYNLYVSYNWSDFKDILYIPDIFGHKCDLISKILQTTLSSLKNSGYVSAKHLENCNKCKSSMCDFMYGLDYKKNVLDIYTRICIFYEILEFIKSLTDFHPDAYVINDDEYKEIKYKINDVPEYKNIVLQQEEEQYE